MINTIVSKIDAQPEEGEEDKVHKDYQKFNMLYWLSQAAPNCLEVAKRLALITEKRTNFVPREHPDMDHWISEASWLEPRSPVSVEELLGKRPLEWFDLFVTFKGVEFRGPDRDGLLLIIGEAVQEDFDWGKELTDLLICRVEPSSDLWKSIIRGWNGAKLSEEQWDYVLSILNNEKLATNHSYHISDLLEHGIKKEEGGIPTGLLNKSNCVAQKVWATLRDKQDGETNDWLTRAINHPGGKLALYWLQALSRTRKETDQKDEGLTQPYRMIFETIISENTEAGALGRVVLASQLGFLFSVDEDWARKNIVPLLDWDRDVRQARQAWDGWLSWGRLSEPLLNELIPLFKKSFCHISSELKSERDRFIEWIVGISIYWLDNPLLDGWLPDFLRSVEEEDRINFA